MQETKADRGLAGEIRAELARGRRTQRWLATSAAMSPATLSRCLDGRRSFTVDELDRVSAALGLRLVISLEVAA